MSTNGSKVKEPIVLGKPMGNDEPNTYLSNYSENEVKQAGMVKAAEILISMSGEDSQRDGLARTPMRFAKAYDYLLGGYVLSPDEAVGEGIFSSDYTGLVQVNDIEFYSLCEHHVLPFWGTASIAYFPNGQILGLSKLARLTNIYARRLQTQERLTRQILESIMETANPRAAIVSIRADHLCMKMRGVEKQMCSTSTCEMFGFENLSSVETEMLKNRNIL